MNTDNLKLADGGALWFDGYAGPEETYHFRRVGTLDYPTWPEDLGAEPAWFAPKVRELEQQLADANDFGRDCVATAENSYLSGIGAL